MAIYHLDAKVISRGAGRSACAAAAYMSCSQIYNDYDGVQHDYTRKQGLVWQQVFLPQYAPQEWLDRAVLWNAVEENEKTKDSRLAREFVVALPVELDKDHWQKLLTEFIQEQFVSDGMCADVAIHDTDGHNPHAHIMLTVRPLDEQGKWQYKREKEYLCVKNGEERGFTAAEFKTAKNEGWEKQYPYKVGKKKVYMAPSEAEAHGYERTSKDPKSTKYGRQNPISDRWNSDEQLILWRKAWADINNRYLEQAGREERIDHRSHAERGIDEQPTIHEGVIARAMEKKGIVSDRCQLNRQIKADNALLRDLKAMVKKLTEAVQKSIPVLANGLEQLRRTLIVFKYQIKYAAKNRKLCEKELSDLKPFLDEHKRLSKIIRDKMAKRKQLTAERDAIPGYLFGKRHDVSVRITTLTEEIEELRSEHRQLMSDNYCHNEADVKAQQKAYKERTDMKKTLEEQETKYTEKFDETIKQYNELAEQAKDVDAYELRDARENLRWDMEHYASEKLRDTYGSKYDGSVYAESVSEIKIELNEYAVDDRLIRERLEDSRRKQREQQERQKQQKQEQASIRRKKRSYDLSL